MITTKLMGGMGNTLFQIANCIAYSKRHHFEYQIPQHMDNYKKYPLYFRHFPLLDRGFEKFGLYKEKSFCYNEIPRKEQIVFEGYFQSWKYFWDYREEVFDAIRPGFKRIEEAAKDFNYISTISIHVRRGDYVEYQDIHPPVTLDYLKQAMGYFIDRGYSHFTVYSDDYEWCKKHIPDLYPDPKMDIKVTVLGVSLHSDPVTDALFDMYTMSRHEHQIISNSTFSLWAAFLNKNPKKIVVAPSNKNWFGPNTEYDPKDIMPDSFVRIEY